MKRLSKAEMIALPPEEFHAYVEAGGDWSDGAERGERPIDSRPNTIPMFDPNELVPTSVRLPLSMVAEISERVGRDRDGRSGLIREAITEYLQHHATGD